MSRGDLWLPTSGVHLVVEERAGRCTDWSRTIVLDGARATLRAHEYRGLRGDQRSMSLVVLVPGDLAIVRATGKTWDELEHRMRMRVAERGLAHVLDAFGYQQQAVA